MSIREEITSIIVDCEEPDGVDVTRAVKLILSYLKSQGVVQKCEGDLPHLIPQVPNNEWSAGYCCGEEAMRDIMIERGYTLVTKEIE